MSKCVRYGLTKLEVLVAAFLCLIAAGFVAMLLARHRENSQRVACINNLRVIGQAIYAFHEASGADEKSRYFPPARIDDGYATWAVLIAPHMIKSHPLHEWDKERSYFAQSDEVRRAALFAYFCPARRRPEAISMAGDVFNDTHFPGALGDYGIVAGDGSVTPDWLGSKANGAIVAAVNVKRKGDRVVYWEGATGLDSLVRGSQYTLMIGEKHVPIDGFGDAAFGDGSLYNGANPASFARLAGPGFPLAASMDAPFKKNFGSYHNGTCNFLMADTSYRPMANETSEAVLGQLARRGE
jgi:prepilin-type processing-associated H-X9-DG protein